MRAPAIQRQRGYVLILTLVAFMGIGGAVIAGYTQQAKDSTDARKAAHNRQVLEQAKQALLMYAYNYPDIAWNFNGTIRGPGRLPCPAADLDGSPDPAPDCTVLGNAMVGRFPWNAPGMQFFDIKDASGESLWYAVSQDYNNFDPADVINSNSPGTITLVDQSGEIIYDGAADGIVAVIIAPGPILGRDNDGNGTYETPQLRSNDAQKKNPINYLDTFGAFDNSQFTNNQNNPADSFILGPIYDPNEGMIVVNDQFVVITADEVLEMAEKKVLETYRDALAAYRANVPGGIYPWLDDFTTDSLTEYDGDIGSFKGRMPAVFGSYFNARPDPTPPIYSDLRLTLYIDDLVISETVAATTPPTAPDIFFDTDGDLVTNFPPGIPQTYYFWDGHPSQTPTLMMDGNWSLCPGTTGTEEDCNLTAGGAWKGGGSTESDVWLQVRRVTVTINSIDNPFEFAQSDLNALPVLAPTVPYTAPAAGTHAYVYREYNNNSGYLTVFQQYDQDFRDDFDVQSSGNLVFNGTDRFAVGMIYYPELPFWAIENNWHHSVQLAIAQDYAPGGNNADCTISGCLVVNNLAATNNDKISLLVIAGEIDNLIDDNAAGFFDDLEAQFAAENNTANETYDRLAENDRVMVLQ